MIKNIINKEHLENPSTIFEKFKNAYPFKHVLLENFLEAPFLQTIRDEFPEPPSAEEMKNEYGRLNRKHTVQQIRDLGDSFKAWDDLLQSDEFIGWLSAATGIDGLIYDPEYHGAGTHNNLHKQEMDVHIDFNFHKTTGYHRRLNLIVYISEEWKKEWGGFLTLHTNPWNPQKDSWVSYPCFGNNAVIFETNEISWHGFDEINLPENKRHLSRKSLTVYYYSVERPTEEIGRHHSTIYVPRPLPDSIKPGKVITDDEYDKLNKSFAQRIQFVQGVYQRESQLLEIIDSQNYLLNQYAQVFKIPTIGFVKQVGKLKGLLPTFVVNDILSTEMEAVKDLGSMKLEGYVPEFVNNGSNVLQILIDGKLAKTVSVTEKFDVELPIAKKSGEKFHFSIFSENRVSPKEMGINNDDTLFCFVFISLTFE